jgi:hypothetical protein
MVYRKRAWTAPGRISRSFTLRDRWRIAQARSASNESSNERAATWLYELHRLDEPSQKHTPAQRYSKTPAATHNPKLVGSNPTPATT